MDVPFLETAEALRDLARFERHRIELMQWLAVRGQVEPPPDVAFAGWRERLRRIEAAAQAFELLASIEPQVRALCPELGQPVPRPGLPITWGP